jgi:filamentous hemagglutinin family protein
VTRQLARRQKRQNAKTRTPARAQRLARRPLSRSHAHLLATTALTGCLIVFAAAASAQTLPSGGVVVGGAAAIATSGSAMTITQSTNRAVINWNSFSIGSGYSVNILQPGAGSISVNQVVGTNPSQIFGSLTSNGQVVIANPNGIWFGPGSSVNTASILATTATMSTPSTPTPMPSTGTISSTTSATSFRCAAGGAGTPIRASPIASCASAICRPTSDATPGGIS